MARRRALVTQHLENVSRGALERYQKIVRKHMTKRQGIYALYRDRTLYYVGLASDLRGRLKSHLRDKHSHSWDRFSAYLTIGDEHMRELEALILRIVKPLGNKVQGKFAKSENLGPKLSRDFNRMIRAEGEQLWGGRTRIGKGPRPHRSPDARAGARRGRRPVLAGLADGPLRLMARYRGKIYRARVRKNGSISFSGAIYNSPSQAGSAVVKRSCNGWTFWSYERSPGDWVRLTKLRAR